MAEKSPPGNWRMGQLSHKPTLTGNMKK